MARCGQPRGRRRRPRAQRPSRARTSRARRPTRARADGPVRSAPARPGSPPSLRALAGPRCAATPEELEPPQQRREQRPLERRPARAAEAPRPRAAAAERRHADARDADLDRARRAAPRGVARCATSPASTGARPRGWPRTGCRACRRSSSRATRGGSAGWPTALDALAGDLLRSGTNLDKRARLAEAEPGRGDDARRSRPMPAPPVALPARAPRIPSVGDAAGRRPRGARLANALGASGGAAADAPRRRGLPAGRRVLAGRAEPRGGRARRAAGDGRADRERRQEPRLRRRRQRRLLPDPAVDQLRPRRVRRAAGHEGLPGDWWVENPDAQAAWARDKIEADRGRRARRRPQRPGRRSARGRRRSSAPPTRTATRTHYDQARELVKRCGRRRRERGGSDVLEVAARRSSASTRSATTPARA